MTFILAWKTAAARGSQCALRLFQQNSNLKSLCVNSFLAVSHIKSATGFLIGRKDVCQLYSDAKACTERESLSDASLEQNENFYFHILYVCMYIHRETLSLAYIAHEYDSH